MANKTQLETRLYPTWRDLYSDSEEAQQEGAGKARIGQYEGLDIHERAQLNKRLRYKAA